MAVELQLQKSGLPTCQILLCHLSKGEPEITKASKNLSKILKELKERDVFKGDSKSFYFYPEIPEALKGESSSKGLAFVGVGELEGSASEQLENFRRVGASLAKALERQGLKEYWIDLDSLPASFAEDAALGIAEGVLLSHYLFQTYKKKPKTLKLERVTFVHSKLAGQKVKMMREFERLQVLIGATHFTRDLANLPPNDLYPSKLAAKAEEMASQCKCTSTVFDDKRLRKEGLELIYAVGKGAAEKPRMVIIEYNKSKSGVPHLCFIGKGITFDSGGISIKPAPKMEEMKFDMSGAAAVLGATMAIAQLKLPVRLTTIVPTAENMSGDWAYRPADLIKSHKGLFVEITNTDAEGRLILADAISYAHQYKPDCIIDLATLTGAVTVALDAAYSGLMGNNEGLIGQIKAAAEKSGEDVWQLPLHFSYDEDMNSVFGDVKNAGNSRGAGSSKGGVFLRRFVDEGMPWAHLDIAGTAYGVSHLPYHDSKFATGVGVRLLTTLAENFKKPPKSKGKND